MFFFLHSLLLRTSDLDSLLSPHLPYFWCNLSAAFSSLMAPGEEKKEKNPRVPCVCVCVVGARGGGGGLQGRQTPAAATLIRLEEVKAPIETRASLPVILTSHTSNAGRELVRPSHHQPPCTGEGRRGRPTRVPPNRGAFHFLQKKVSLSVQHS